MIKRIYSSLLFRFNYYFRGGRKKSIEFARQRAINQMKCYDYPSENNGWKKYGATPVYGNLKTGNVFDPYNFIYHDKIWMVVSCRKQHVIKLLSSIDGIEWKSECTLLCGIKNTWEDIVNRACLIPVGETWHLFYTGQRGTKSAIGHLTSIDFKDFKRDIDNHPVITPTLACEGESVMNPCVIWNEQKQIFQMWYSGGEQYEPDVILYAESRDGNNWVKHKTPVLQSFPQHIWEQCKIGGCDVKLSSDGIYTMYYIGYQNIDVARICYATSTDGINWERSDKNILIAPSKNRFDSDATYKPSILDYQEKMMMWYNGRRGVEEYIGLAIKEEEKEIL